MKAEGTHQSGDFHVRVAASTLRVIAGVIDLAIPVGITLGVCWVSGYPDLSKLPPRYWNYLDYIVEVLNCCPMVIVLPAAIFAGLYVAFMTAFTATIGNSPFSRLVGIRVRNRKGKPAGFIRAFFWSLLGLVFSLIAFVGPLWTIVDPKRRMLHDILTGVVVVFGHASVPMVESDPVDLDAAENLAGPTSIGQEIVSDDKVAEVPWRVEGRNW